MGSSDRLGINGDWLGCNGVCWNVGCIGVCWNVDCIGVCSDVVTKFIEINLVLPYSYIYLVTTLCFCVIQLVLTTVRRVTQLESVPRATRATL